MAASTGVLRDVRASKGVVVLGNMTESLLQKA